MTSPNHPGDYPNNVDRTEIIEVEKGKVLMLEFNRFDVWVCKDIATCSCEFVKITDGNGTTFLDNSCGFSSIPDPNSPFYFKPPTITSSGNRVEVVFHSDGEGQEPGWSLSWSAVTPGECQLFLDGQMILWNVMVEWLELSEIQQYLPF